MTRQPNFVKGNAMAKGARLMELKMWYSREEYQNGSVSIEHHAGISLSPDKQTKLGNVMSNLTIKCNFADRFSSFALILLISMFLRIPIRKFCSKRHYREFCTARLFKKTKKGSCFMFRTIRK